MVNIPLLEDMLFWCTVINYAVLLLWFVVFVAARDWLFALHGRWFRLSPSQFDVLHYGGMAIYKIAILVLNLVPYLALHIVSAHAG